jgi:hypothetical protein
MLYRKGVRYELGKKPMEFAAAAYRNHDFVDRCDQ